MACVNISGVLYQRDTIAWNASVNSAMDLPDDSSETLDPSGVWMVANLTTTSSTGVVAESFTGSSSSGGVVCMFNPEQMLEPWEINKNLGMIVSYSVIFVIGVLGNITAMLVSDTFLLHKDAHGLLPNESISQGMIGDRKSRNATTLFLVSLSAADLLLLLVCAPVSFLFFILSARNPID